MRARFVSALIVTVLLLAACASAPTTTFPWRESVAPTTALPDRVALFIDASYILRAPDYRQYLAISESIDLATDVNDAVELAITGAKMKLVAQKKYFIGAHRSGQQLVAEKEEAELYLRDLPVHLDPTICRTEKTTAAVVELWKAARRAYDGEITMDSKITREIAGRFQADTLALVYAISRKEDSSPDAPPLAIGPALDTAAASMIGVVMVRAIDGKIVYQAKLPISGPQRVGTLRVAIRGVFSGLPERQNHPKFPVPSRLKGEDNAEPADNPSDSQWVGTTPAPGSRGRPEGIGVKVDLNASRPGVLGGVEKISLLRRPMAIADPIAITADGTEVRVLKKDMNWYLVMLPDGTMGWVYHTFVTVY
ncbi:MAG: hypothetical protein P9L99_15880 [Candidatus Lernaella stagnicola]|nr:hypothetical protein [Candidatus Lernaella stagnicola]